MDYKYEIKYKIRLENELKDFVEKKDYSTNGKTYLDYVVIENIKTDCVGIGTKVKIEYIDDDETEEYSIVGSKEADPFESKISNESPIAQALMNHKVGDVVTVESPNGSYEVEIKEIK